MSKVVKKLPPSPLAERIRSRMVALGISQAELARRAKVTPVFLSELLRGTKQTMKPDRLRDFAVALGVSTDHLVGAAHHVGSMSNLVGLPRATPDLPRIIGQDEMESWAPTNEELSTSDEDGSHNTLLPIFRRQKHISFRLAGSIEAAIPVYGETIGELIAIDTFAEGTVARPPLLRWNDGAYAVIADGSMSPRYNAGEILFVAPGAPVRDGDYVVIVTRSNSAGELFGRVCRLKDVTNTHVLVEMLSPQRTETIGIATVAHIHRIVLAGQKSLD